MTKKITIALATACVLSVQAKTIALWPMEQETGAKAPDTRCAIDPANDLINLRPAQLKTVEQTVGWNLPPNPDVSDGLLFQPVNRYAFDTTTASGSGPLVTSNAAISAALVMATNWTVEGWIKYRNLPSGTSWSIIAQSGGGSAGNQGSSWIWSIRSHNGYLDFQLFLTGRVASGHTSADAPLTDALTDEQAASLSNGWHHVALVCRRDGAQSKITFYLDGTEHKTLTYDTLNNAIKTPEFFLAGRPNDRRANAFYDYWRISDEALSPASFLNAGGAGSAVAEISPTTVAYWKLDVDESGRLDTRDYAGAANLGVALLETPTNLFSGVLASTNCAFSGNPPNPTVTLANGNAGSALMRNHSSYLRFPELGTQLETTNSFTVEGWIRHRMTFDDAATYGAIAGERRYHYLFHTRTSANGWVLQLSRGDAGDAFFQLIVEDPDGKASSGDAYLVGHTFPAFGPDRISDWMHVALVRDRVGTGSKGIWTLYVNGELCGSVTDNHEPVGPSGGTEFAIGGRGGTSNAADQFYGNVDCVRVSKAALSPTQLLCATNGTAATDVIAFWPLNSAEGKVLNVIDLTGNWTVSSGKYASSTYLPSAITGDAPTIANPDASAAYHGGTDALRGCASFTGRQLLMTLDKDVIALLNGQHAWTLEFYCNRTTAVSSWEIIAISAKPSLNDENVGCSFNYSWRNTGVVLLDGMSRPSGSTGDVVMPDTTSALSNDGQWHHVALTRTCPTDKKPVFTFYVDGNQQGSSLTGTQDVKGSTAALCLFGRNSSNHAFKGKVSSVRLSNVVLDPSQFLCGTVPLSRETVVFRTGTIAYWPFEWDGTTRDLAGRTTPDFPPSGAESSDGITGTADQAIVRVPRADATLGIKANTGSITLARNTSLVFSNVGLQLEPSRAFTVEGWIKWNADAGGLPEMLFGTYRTTVDAGWRVATDTSGGTPKLRLLAKAPGNWTPVADGVLADDISDWNGQWVHVALVYDPNAGTCGRWSLYAFGELCGSVDNDWLNPRKLWKLQRFSFGAPATATQRGFTGGLDQWRISGGALGKNDFLWCPPRGTMVLFR